MPAADYLFDLGDEKDAKRLQEEQVITFHYAVDQLLLIHIRARRNIQTPVAFLIS